MAKPLLVVDGTGYIFRAYFGLKQARTGGRNIAMTTSTGLPTGALHVFSSMILRLYLDVRPERCVVVFDPAGPTFRNQLDPNYKANRSEPPDDLVPQFPWFERIVQAFQLPVLRIPGVEADDVIATLVRRARAAGEAVEIYSGDKDLMQLVTDEAPTVVMVDSLRDVRYDAARVEEKFGVPPSRVGDFLALRGDAVDNIPGVSGIGDVTAAKLLVEHGSIDGILAHAGEFTGRLAKTFADPVELANLALSRQLVTLMEDVPLPDAPDALRRRDWDVREVASIFRELEFNRFLARLEATFVSDPTRYLTLLELGEVEAYLGAARATGELAVELELSPGDAPSAVLLGIALATPGRPAAYVPIGHRYLGAPVQLGAGVVTARLAEVLAVPGLVLHVADQKRLDLLAARHGVAAPRARCDVGLASFLLDPARGDHSLDAAAKEHLGHELAARDKRSFEEREVAEGTRLAAERADVTLALGRLLRGRLENAGLTKLLDEVELPLARVLAGMELAGVRVDTKGLAELGERLGRAIEEIEKKIVALVGAEVNVASPKQLGELLYVRLGLRTARMRKTRTGGYSTDAEQLEELLEAHPVVPLILEHRELAKLKGTYLDALPHYVRPKTSRLHTSYLQTGATTGRLASVNPNVQNIPIRSELGREIRRAFVAEPGCVLVSADYSQIELRVLAHLSGDRLLCEAFAAERDVHAQTAAEVFGVPLDSVTASQRRVAKAVNYGLGYGQGDFGLARTLDIPRDEARRYIENYFARFSGVREHMERVVAEAKQTLVVTTLLGRRLPIPGLDSDRQPVRAAAERLARNAPIQGSAADILKLAMLGCQRRIDEERLPARMILTVHDELVFEVPEAEASGFAAVAREVMELALPLSVPLRVDIGIARTWADAH